MLRKSGIERRARYKAAPHRNAKNALIWFLLLSFSYFSSPAAGQASGAPKMQGETYLTAVSEEAIDEIVQSALDNVGAAGVTLSVVSDGGVSLIKGYGFADLEAALKVDPHEHLFRIGSITKTFTFTAIMQLVEKGQIDLNADVNAYLTAFQIPEHSAGPVRIKDLLTHRSGFDIVLNDLFVRDPSAFISLETWLKENVPARVRPAGIVTSYDNYGAALAGYIVQEVSGETYEDYLKAHIFDPLKMNSSTARQILRPENPKRMAADKEKRVAAVYHWQGKTPERQRFELVVGAPAGAISATSADMARYMLAHLNGGALDGRQIMNADTARVMKSRPYPGRPSTDYVHGFRSRNILGFTSFEHDGATFTTYSSMVMIPELDLGVFVSVTGGGGSAADIARNIVIDLIGERAKPSPQTVPLESAAPYAGVYLTSRRSHRTTMKLLTYFGGRSKVSASDRGGLLIERDGSSSEYRYIGNNAFQLIGGEERISFELNKAGVALRYYNGKGHEAMERMPIGSSKNVLMGIFTLAVFASVFQLALFVLGRVFKQAQGFSKNISGWAATLTSIFALGSAGLFFLTINEIKGAGNAILFIWPTPFLFLLQVYVLALIGSLLLLTALAVKSLIKRNCTAVHGGLATAYISIQSAMVYILGAWNLVGFQL